MLGVVLCGGQSNRMGTDKGMLKLQAGTWAQTALEKLSTLQLPVKLSINTKQYEAYSSVFSPAQLITDSDSLNIKGPLYGLMSVHLQYPQEDLLILACDMPLMESGLLKELVTASTQYPADAFVYSNDSEPEPLCGVYKAAGLEQVLKLYQSNQLLKHSMKYMLEHINTHFISLPAEKKNCFRNFNAHAELNGL